MSQSTLYTEQQRIVESTIKGKIKERIYSILLAYPDTRPRAKKSYKMLYWRYTRRFGVFPTARMDSKTFGKWLTQPDEQSLGRIKRMVIRQHPDLLDGMREEPQQRARINEEISRRVFASLEDT